MMRRSKQDLRQLNGVLVLDKSIGVSSNQALQNVKQLYKAKKAGHTGSLDPLATGVLPICFGEATKFSQFLLESDKVYQTSICLGVKTATGDKEGAVLERRPVKVIRSDVESVLNGFIGENEQIPSMYSALKHKGQPLYKLARQGIEVKRKARKIVIKKIELCDFSGTELLITVLCSKGTYIRTLAEDIGEKLGCCAHVGVLRRLKAGPYGLKQAYDLNELMAFRDQESDSMPPEVDCGLSNIKTVDVDSCDSLSLAEIKKYGVCDLSQISNLQLLDQKLFPIDSAVSHLPEVYLDEIEVQSIVMGRTVAKNKEVQLGNVRLYKKLTDSNKFFLGVGEVVSCGLVAPKRLLRTSRFEKQ